jgi:hypothetical protein
VRAGEACSEGTDMYLKLTFWLTIGLAALASLLA